MKNLYVISGITGMTGNELARQIVKRGDDVIGFDNFFASSIETIQDVLESEQLTFFEGDINNCEQMQELEQKILSLRKTYQKVIHKEMWK